MVLESEACLLGFKKKPVEMDYSLTNYMKCRDLFITRPVKIGNYKTKKLDLEDMQLVVNWFKEVMMYLPISEREVCVNTGIPRGTFKNWLKNHNRKGKFDGVIKIFEYLRECIRLRMLELHKHITEETGEL